MLEADLDPARIQTSVRFHRTLNPLLWHDDKLRPIVRLHLLRAAHAFYEFLDLPDLKLRDVVLTGSSAAYNYTDYSDLDVHLIVAIGDLPCADLASDLFLTKKALWSATYDVTVRGLPVELYVEDAADPARANGVYSLLRDVWRHHPSPVKPPLHDRAVVLKTEDLAARIDALVSSDAPLSEIDDLLARLKDMRRSGLEQAGEFSVENMAFKALRALGVLDKLRQARRVAVERDLSL